MDANQKAVVVIYYSALMVWIAYETKESWAKMCCKLVSKFLILDNKSVIYSAMNYIYSLWSFKGDQNRWMRAILILIDKLPPF